MKKIYCRNCQERIKLRDGIYERLSPFVGLDATECRATGGLHEPRQS